MSKMSREFIRLEEEEKSASKALKEFIPLIEEFCDIRDEDLFRSEVGRLAEKYNIDNLKGYGSIIK